MALDQGTLTSLSELSVRWKVSRAEVMRRAVRRAKEEADLAEALPKPLEALDWLQNGGGLNFQESEAFREEMRAERQAKRCWWES